MCPWVGISGGGIVDTGTDRTKSEKRGWIERTC